MPRNLWLCALCLLTLSACSTTPRAVPAKIDPPPAALTLPCKTPADLQEGASAQDLATWSTAWIRAYGCERSRRAGLVEAWPR